MAHDGFFYVRPKSMLTPLVSRAALPMLGGFSAPPPLVLALRGGNGAAAVPVLSNAGLVLSTAIMKNMIGAGAFAILTALNSSRTGLLPGLVILALVAGASALSFNLLGEATMNCDGEVITMEQLWQQTIGRGAWLIGIAGFVQGFGALVQFSATCSDLMAGSLPPRCTHQVRTLLFGAAMLPLCLADDLNALRHSSAIGLGGVLYAAAFSAWRALDGSYGPGGRFAAAAASASGGVAPTSLLAGGVSSLAFVGVMNTACFAHLNVPAYWDSWRRLNAERVGATNEALLRGFKRVVALSFGAATALYSVFLLAGSSTFGSGIDSRLALLRYAPNDIGAGVVRAATLVSVGCGYPLIFQAIRDMVIGWILPPSPPRALRKLTSAALLASITVLALLVDNVAWFLSLRGASLGALLVYTLPTVVGLASSAKRGEGSMGRRTLLRLIGLYGVISSVVGTAVLLR